MRRRFKGLIRRLIGVLGAARLHVKVGAGEAKLCFLPVIGPDFPQHPAGLVGAVHVGKNFGLLHFRGQIFVAFFDLGKPLDGLHFVALLEFHHRQARVRGVRQILLTVFGLGNRHQVLVVIELGVGEKPRFLGNRAQRKHGLRARAVLTVDDVQFALDVLNRPRADEGLRKRRSYRNVVGVAL